MPVITSLSQPVTTTGVAYTPAGTTPVTSEALVVNVRSSPIKPVAGRNAYAWITGSGTASGYFIYSKDQGVTWSPMYFQNTQLAVFSYSKPASLGSQDFAGQKIPIPIDDQSGEWVALIASAVSGTVNVEITQ